MPGHWSYIALALYLASLALYGRFLYTGRLMTGRLATAALALGIISHYLALLERSRWVRSVPYDDLYGSLSLFGFLLAVTYLGLERYYHQRSMSVLAYAAFALAFVLSLIYLLQVRRLRHRRPGPVVWRFPPLDALERMSRGSVRVGLLSLIAGTILGIIWQWQIRGHFLLTDPKVLVTLVILLLYGGYLWLSRSASGRGARASALCILNFVLVIFSYAVVNLYLSHFHKYL
jgi:ABC-type transport system involved in cytochrome c biogenesis permease subunit